MMMCGVAQATFILIDDAGNTADSTGYGAVGYAFHIFSTEVTIAQFQASGAGNGNEGYWNESPRSVGPNGAASYVSLYEAMKYCNWMTSGDVNSGAYVFNEGAYQSTDRASAISLYGTIYALPTEDEWYKAAYYTGNAGDPWSLYAHGADTAPTRGTANGWNYRGSGVNDFATSSPNYTWQSGYGAEEQNATYNMMGNVWEWLEDAEGVIRGGSYNSTLGMLGSSYRDGGFDPEYESNGIGFRIVTVVPEPTSMAMLAMGGLGAWLLRLTKLKRH